MASLLLVPFQPKLLKKFHIKAASNSIRNEKTSSFSFRSKANVPIYELPGASFDQYMDDKQRVFRAVFSDNKGLTTQLNEEVWRIKMPPIQCLFLNIKPTADVRLTFKSNGEDYPPHIPHHVTKVLELHFIRWELQGLNTFNKNPYHISLDVKGSLYPERKGKYSWLKNQMEMKITFCVSPGTTFIPENILEDALELVFKTVLDEMKQEFHGRLLEDYNRFKRNKSKKNSV
ncbi:uncharacterized protein LOC109819128 isoform X1 [Cajanus cajan]|uniref:Uncharacterized protein n=1 Tax=Cajanus cajan TaxID=3821 RepID=A0A151RFK9_CAJCA|nr:uncharacterized protein LOC109819128 isoform X1 [Cajanus cajan]KYP41307.1 hypothetical protein KK1_037327 [Cajanus cajan]